MEQSRGSSEPAPAEMFNNNHGTDSQTTKQLERLATLQVSLSEFMAERFDRIEKMLQDQPRQAMVVGVSNGHFRNTSVLLDLDSAVSNAFSDAPPEGSVPEERQPVELADGCGDRSSTSDRSLAHLVKAIATKSAASRSKPVEDLEEDLMDPGNTGSFKNSGPFQVRAEFNLSFSHSAGTPSGKPSSQWGRSSTGPSVAFETSSQHFVSHSKVSRSLRDRLLYSTVIRPSSPFMVFWEMMAVCIVLFDMFELPLQIFDPPKSKFLDVMRWLAQIFWNVDLLVSFRAGYVNGDKVIMEPSRIAIHYLKTWFPFDIMIVGTDWVLYILDHVEGYILFAKAGKTLKALRAARTMKMLRLMKMRKAFSTFEDHVVSMLSGYQTPVLGIAKFFLGVMLVCHFLCTAWYWSGLVGEEEGWVHRYRVEDLEFWKRYLITFHWALAQFGVGNNDIFGETVIEFLVNIGILLTGLLLTALLVSSVTNTFSVMQQQTADQFHQMWLLRRFCTENEMPWSLSKRIAEHVEKQITSRHRSIQLTEVKLLAMVSKPLLAEVMFHLHLPQLCSHPFLRLLCRDYHYTMRGVASTAVHEQTFAESDVVFTQGTVGKAAFNVINGTMQYTQPIDDETSRRSFEEAQMVEAPRWISEAVLWVADWVHQGDLNAKSTAQCLVLDAQLFCEEIRRHNDTLILVQTYAKARVEELRKILTEDLSDVSEIDKRFGFIKLTSSELYIPGLSRRMSYHTRRHPWKRFWAFVWERLMALGLCWCLDEDEGKLEQENVSPKGNQLDKITCC